MSTPKALSEDEIQQFLAWFKPDNYYAQPLYNSTRDKLAFLIMVDAGLRIGELVLLLWEDLILEKTPHPILHLNAEITKTKFPRDIPTTERIRDQIERFHISSHRDTLPRGLSYVFPSTNTLKHISTRHLSRIIKNASLKAIGHPITAHALRHTFATRLLRHTSTRVVQQLLGHKSLQSTQIYTHPNSQDLKQAIDKL